MLTAERYLTLYDRFGVASAGLPVEATLEELAETLFCTPRNAKLVLKKLEEEGLIAWLPGRGRGNRSRLAFKADKEDYLVALATSNAENGNYRIAFELLETYGGSTEARTRFVQWLNGRFGLHQETVGGHEDCDTLRFPVYRTVQTLDPGQVNYAFDAHLLEHIFDRLVTYDEQLERIVPSVAHTWSSDESATVWTFHLRKGVLFHNGRELTAEDVAFSFERLRRPGTANRWIVRSLDAVEIVGPRCIRFLLHKPNFIFDRFLCATATSILPRNYGGMSEEDYWLLPCGSGPFLLLSLSDHRIELSAHRAYFAERPLLDGVDIVILPEDCRELSTFGLPSILQTHDSDPLHPLKSAPSPDWQSLARLCKGCTLLTWNTNKAGWQQHETFRRAVFLMANRERMIADLGGERALAAYAIRPEDSLKYMPRAVSDEDIRTMLEGTGYDGQPLRLLVHDKYEMDGRWFANRIGQFGIPCKLVVAGWKEIDFPELINGCDFTFSGLVIAEDEICEIDFYEHEACVMNYYLDKGIKAWIVDRIDEALASPHAQDRWRIMRVIETRLRDEYYICFLHHRRLNTILHPSVKGAAFGSNGWIDFRRIWLEHAV
ncbi:ABC transporter substrate-binding protein [Cohnella sp. 56]|uniref:ABC transporter substrate-binding protein n=1 Tax=Cohnella sp. 56 TaxID=3113722 RepID=UPI0030E9DB34